MRPFDFKSVLFYSLLFFFLKANAQSLELKVEGNDSIESNIIETIGFLKSHSETSSMYKALDTLGQQLTQAGYLEYRRTTLKAIKDSVFYSKFQLGKVTKMATIYYDTNETPRKLLEPLASIISDSTVTIPIVSTSSFLKGLSLKLEQNGRLFDILQLKDLSKKGNNITARLQLTKNGSRKIDSIVVRGYDKFPMSFIKRTSKLKVGKSLDRSVLIEESNSLNSLPFINQLKAPEILFEKEKSTIYLYFEKAKSNFFDGFLGFAQGSDGKLQLNGYVDLKLTNNLNKGESLNIIWKNDGNEQTRFNADVKIPYLFNSPLGIEGGLEIFRKDSTFLNTDLKLRLSYQLSPRSSTNIGINQYESNNLASNNSASTNQQIDDLEALSLSAGYTYSVPNTDDLLFLKKTQLFIESSFGNRKSSTSRDQQISLIIDGDHLWKLNFRNRIYTRFSGAYLSSDNYFENEKLRLGGINSIRGFNENNLEATGYAYTNLEYRYLIANNSYISSITDIGVLRDDLAKTTNTLFGFGVGLGIRSSAGLFKLNYAIGKTSENSVKFSDAKVHISFSSVF